MNLDRVFLQVIRGRLAISLTLVAAPVVLLIVLGSFWLAEHRLLLPFLLAFAGLFGLWRLGLWMLKRRVRSAQAQAVVPIITGNPEWTQAERAAFDRLIATIAERVAEPLPWPALQTEAMAVLERAAFEVSGGKRRALDFSIPEALLLADRVLGRLRSNMRRYVPMADQIRIETIRFFWSHRRKVGTGFGLAKGAWRLSRMVANPMTGLLQEAQALLLSPANAQLQFAGQAVLQRIVLEEIAVAAIDLHCGYLRYTEAELLEIDLAATDADQGRLVVDDQPLRVLIVGQISAGKSTLLNAMSGDSRAETDMAPTTAGLVAHRLMLEEEDLTFVDTAGVDGSKAVEDQLLAELLQADLVIWAIRANRPARAPDVTLLNRLREACDSALRRRPPVIVALTGVDLLLPGWPFAEHLLPPEALAHLAAVIDAAATDLAEPRLVPLCLEPPVWNLSALESLILSTLPEALMVQRNRRRLERKGSTRAEISKGIDGIGQAARFLIGRMKK